MLSLGERPDFDGPLLGIGFTANFRFGQDPDAPQAQVRAVKSAKASIPNAFAALQSWYVKNRIDTVTLVNTEKVTLTSAEFWLELQLEWDLWNARQRASYPEIQQLT